MFSIGRVLSREIGSNPPRMSHSYRVGSSFDDRFADNKDKRRNAHGGHTPHAGLPFTGRGNRSHEIVAPIAPDNPAESIRRHKSALVESIPGLIILNGRSNT